MTVVGCTVIYYGAVLPRGRVYGSLLQAGFDLYRRRLYDALDWPTVDDPATEPAAGAELTTYLWRGIAPPTSASPTGRSEALSYTALGRASMAGWPSRPRSAAAPLP